MKTIEFIEKNKVVAICRKIYGDDLIRLVDALLAGGIKMVEVTFDQADPACLDHTGEAIRAIHSRFSDAVLAGAGTVVTEEQVETAAEAGAAYMISPNTDLSVIRKTLALGTISIPGAMTPSEILTAHNAGAHFVKLFPAGFLGLSYIKEIKAPISHVKMLAVGGVNADNFASFLDAGMAGAGLSSYLCNRDLVKEGNFEEITRRAHIFSKIVRERESK